MSSLISPVRPLLLNLVLLSVLPMLSSQCDQKRVADTCIQGRIVRITCATTVIQVLNVDTLGEDNWSDGSLEGKKYDNVFSVANKCDIPATIKTGDELTFRLGDSITEDCIVCMMYDNPPKVKLGIVNINDCKLQK